MRLILITIALISLLTSCNASTSNPRVFILTDINIDQGDPDDRQSLIHLLWYANELEIEGIVPDRWNAKGYEACEMAVNAYSTDYIELKLENKGYPSPANISSKIARDMDHSKNLFIEAASKEEDPLYVLIWGSMNSFKEILLEKPELSKNIRVITIGTGLMLERDIAHLPANWEKHEPCKQMNWNAGGRNDIYNDSRFKDMWWLELNWTYNGMFSGPEPAEMLKELVEFGKLGAHMKEVVKNQSWAQYFRVGDTPTVLYLIDPENDLDNPEKGSWAGRFCKPFPNERPNYYTDISEGIEWNYSNPCETWENHQKVKNTSLKTLVKKRQEMYDELLIKLKEIYNLRKST